MPTDPATVPPLTDAEVAELVYAQCPTLRSEEKNATAQWWVGDVARAAYALAASRVDTAEVERRAARKALAECAAWLGKGESQPVRFDEDGRFLLAFERVNAFSDRYLARLYPAPAPRECVLSDGSVVTRNPAPSKFPFMRTYPRGGVVMSRCENDWRLLADTGADFDALKRFAAEVGQ